MICKHCNNGTEVSTDCKHTPEETQAMIHEQVLRELEESDSFKVGYLSGMCRTTLYFLYRGRPDEAKRHLENGLRILKMEGHIEGAK
jgi:hypothetical protein